MALIPSSLRSRSALVSAVASLGEAAKAKLAEVRLEVNTGAKAKEAESRKASMAFSVVDTIINTGKLMAGSKLDLPEEVRGRGIAWLIDVVLHYVTAALTKATPQQLQEFATLTHGLAETLWNVGESEISPPAEATATDPQPTDEAEGG